MDEPWTMYFRKSYVFLYASNHSNKLCSAHGALWCTICTIVKCFDISRQFFCRREASSDPHQTFCSYPCKLLSMWLPQESSTATFDVFASAVLGTGTPAALDPARRGGKIPVWWRAYDVAWRFMTFRETSLWAMDHKCFKYGLNQTDT